MRVEVELSPVIATGEMLELARMVDEAGADRLGVSDVAMQRDTFLVQARCAEATHRVQIGSLVSNPYVRRPAADRDPDGVEIAPRVTLSCLRTARWPG